MGVSDVLKKIMSVLLCMIMLTITGSLISGEERVSVVDLKHDSTTAVTKSNTFQKNTISLEGELKQEAQCKKGMLLKEDDKSVVYITKSKDITPISVSYHNVRVRIFTVARCIVDKDSGKVLLVEDFGKPYIHIDSPAYLKFEHGEFNIDSISDTSARISTTGQFFVDRDGVSVGLDIISLPRHRIIKSEVETLSAKFDW